MEIWHWVTQSAGVWEKMVKAMKLQLRKELVMSTVTYLEWLTNCKENIPIYSLKLNWIST